jgi:tetraacyldisaccharide 4'-kinase
MGARLRNYIIGIIEGREKGIPAAVIGGGLWGLSQVYGLAVRVRTMLYRIGLLRRRSLDCLTISVGNITVGGTGKTPVVEALAATLAERGRNVAILSRGYKSERRRRGEKSASEKVFSTRIVSDGRRVLLDAAHAGDEPYLLARNLKGVVVLVDKDRVKAGRYAISQMAADAVILDDGFQHLPLGRRQDLVLIDCTNPFGNGHLLPRGVLRESVSSLKRADWLVLTKTTGVDVGPIRARLQRINPWAAIIETIHQPLYVEEVATGNREPPAFLRGKDLYVFSAIARPQSFEASIERLGGRIAGRLRFLDHHRFTPEEMRRIQEEASATGAEAILTTEKDSVRLPTAEETPPIPIYFLRVAIQVTGGAEDFADFVSEVCGV